MTLFAAGSAGVATREDSCPGLATRSLVRGAMIRHPGATAPKVGDKMHGHAVLPLARISHTIFARSRGLRDELIRVSGTCSLVAPEDASGAGTLSGLRVAAND